ncbi:hypothetical protein FD754_014277, partial [Muntiacus muntjak]
VVMYGCESWTVKKAERRRIDAFELWCWRRLLRVPWTARRSNQSILKEINPDAGKDWGQEEKGTTEDEKYACFTGEGNGNPLQYSCLENPMDRGAWQATVHGVARVGHDLVTKPPPPYLFYR